MSIFHDISTLFHMLSRKALSLGCSRASFEATVVLLRHGYLHVIVNEFLISTYRHYNGDTANYASMSSHTYTDSYMPACECIQKKAIQS